VFLGCWVALVQLRGVKGSVSPFRRRVSEDGLKRPEEVSIKCV
jgi:inositol phosphorylceramide mannosyltransferase catalytic subunit